MTRKKIKPAMKMRAFHWKRVLIDQDMDKPSTETVWRGLGSFDFDQSEFSQLFTTVRPKKAKEPRESKRQKVELTRVLDSKVSQAVAIMLKNLSSIEATYFAILKMDATMLDEDNLNKVIGNLPTPQDMKNIEREEKVNPRVAWDKPERYFKIISRIPCLRLRLETWLFAQTVGPAAESALRHLVLLRKACRELRQSSMFKNVLEVVLTIGNYLNGGKKRLERADGFEVRTLTRFRETKGADRETTLLAFVAQTCKAEYAEAKQMIEVELKSVLASGGGARLGGAQRDRFASRKHVQSKAKSH